MTGGFAGGDGDKKRILISGLRGEPQGVMRLASARPKGNGKATREARGGCELSLVTNGNIFRHNFYGHESFSSSPFFLLSRFSRFCFTFANCQCKAASDIKLFRFASVFFLFFLGKVEINFTVNAHNQVCVALVPPFGPGSMIKLRRGCVVDAGSLPRIPSTPSTAMQKTCAQPQ